MPGKQITLRINSLLTKRGACVFRNYEGIVKRKRNVEKLAGGLEIKPRRPDPEGREYFTHGRLPWPLVASLKELRLPTITGEHTQKHQTTAAT
jgi:hypothetical protein